MARERNQRTRRIIFQGDSITDAGRFSDGVGTGYYKIVSEFIEDKYKDYECFNLGINGHRTKDINLRIEHDTMTLSPKIVTLLIGINDISGCAHGDNVSNEDFEGNLVQIIKKIKDGNSKLIVISPYMFEYGIVNEKWRVFFDEKQAIVEALALKNADRYIPLDKIFKNKTKDKNLADYTTDGVHLTALGHEIIAETLIVALEDVINESGCNGLCLQG